MLIGFLLVSARVAGLFIGAPILSRPELPRRFKAMVVFAIAGMLGAVALPAQAPEGAAEILPAFVSEFALGLTIGLMARCMIATFQMAGEMMGRQMGFAMANGFDPETQTESSVIATLHTNLAGLIFLLVDGHHMLLRSLASSYELFPLGAALQAPILAETLVGSAGRIFADGARIAGPVTGIMLLINVMLGFMNKINPQLSIFNVGLPLTVMAGMLAVVISTPDTVASVMYAYDTLTNDISLLVGR